MERRSQKHIVDVKILVDDVFKNLDCNIAQTAADTVIENSLDSEYKGLSLRTKNDAQLKLKHYLMQWIKNILFEKENGLKQWRDTLQKIQSDQQYPLQLQYVMFISY